jgi:hypothetical protein
MGILKKSERREAPTAAKAPVETPGKRPSDLLDAIAGFFPPGALRMRAPTSSWEFGKPRPASEEYRIDDDQVRQIRRAIIGIEDEHGTMHVVFSGAFSKCSLEKVQSIPEAEKNLAENRRRREEERQKYEREHPVKCPVKVCTKRFKNAAGLKIHMTAKSRRDPDDAWSKMHAEAIIKNA